jgi:hypothetical protein
MTVAKSRRGPAVLLGAVLVWLGVAAVSAEAAVLHVANNGVDAASCGPRHAPCRSISQAITNAASAGDRIVVGPGHYGDLNHDGDLDDPGDETGRPDLDCQCLLSVHKPVTIESRDGASATVLGAGRRPLHVVRITASGAAFGQPGRGFTVTGAGSAEGEAFHGIVVGPGAARTTVAGNQATDNDGHGLSIEGNDHLVSGNVASASGGHGLRVAGRRVQVIGNHVTASMGAGVHLAGDQHRVVRNTARINGGDGFVMQDSSGVELRDNQAADNAGSGFVVAGQAHELRGNTASASRGPGFLVRGDGIALERNLAMANATGYLVDEGSSRIVLSGNSAVGNRGPGIALGASAPAGQAVLVANNVYGNDSGHANCGLINASGGFVDAAGTFWGVVTGPGADPADDVCNGAGSTTGVIPAAPEEISRTGRPGGR